MSKEKKSPAIIACDKWLGQRTERGISVGQIWDGGWKTGQEALLVDIEHRIKCLPIFGDPFGATGKVLLRDVLQTIKEIREGKPHA